MTALAQDTVNKLLDFNQKMDIGLLDTVVGTLYSGTGDQQKMAQEVLTTLKEHPDAWTKVRDFLKFFSMQIISTIFGLCNFFNGYIFKKKYIICNVIHRQES